MYGVWTSLQETAQTAAASAALRQFVCAGEAKPSWSAQLKEKSKEVFRGVGTVFRTGSFLLILAGNIISVIIGLGLGYKIMYLQVWPPVLWCILQLCEDSSLNLMDALTDPDMQIILP